MDKRIGEHFIGLNRLSFEQCEEVLKYQKKNPHKKFGEISIELGYLKQDEVSEYINSIL